MHKFLFVAVILTGWSAACGHTKSVTPAPEQDRSSDEGHDQPPTDAPHGHRETRKEPPSHAPAVPLATSPASLLRPGAAAILQDKLIGRGLLDPSDRSQELDGKTEKALRDFQRDQGLPATGTPDDLTVRKLGLDPASVFRSSREEHK